MRKVATEELVRVALGKFIYLHSKARIALLKRIRKECPFRIDGKCENPLNPKIECTYEPHECPYINMIAANSQPLPALLVPVRSMERAGLIEILMDDKGEIEVIPGKNGGTTHARRAALLLFRALHVYGNPEKRKIRNLERLS